MIKRLLFKGTEEKSVWAELSMTALRLFTGVSMAVAHGFKKVPPSEEFIAGVGKLGFPMPIVFAWSAGLAELVGGIFLAIGLMTRPAAAFIAFTMAVAAFGRHASDPFKLKELALVYLFVALVFVVRGSGKYSVDKFIAR